MTRQLHKAVDAYLASPSIAPMLPPPVGIPRKRSAPKATQKAENDRHPLAHLMRLRDQAAAEVERLLAFLDVTDGIDDQEDVSEDEGAAIEAEPSLGSRSSGGGDQSLWGVNDTCQLIDAEAEHDGCEPDEDGEPLLGSLDRQASQGSWSGGGDTDFEGDAAGEDDEPSLGSHSTDERSQEHWAQGDREDREGYDTDMEPSLCGIGGHDFQPQPSATCRDLDLEGDAAPELADEVA